MLGADFYETEAEVAALLAEVRVPTKKQVQPANITDLLTILFLLLQFLTFTYLQRLHY